ncbi:hypothetical protein BH09VER1_BH09VER1_19780 [soil metagenome]
MTPISDVLKPEHVILNLAAKDKKASITESITKLAHDPSVHDFAALQQAIETRDAASISENGVGICIAHGRTDSVSSLVLTAARSLEGFTTSEVAEPVKLLFVAGIPSAFSAEYLRIVGVIARVCRDEHKLQKLLTVKTAQEFVDILSAGELRL